MRLASKLALISGTGRGIGAAAAERFAAEGATVVGGDLPDLDVTDETSAQRWIDDAVKQHGRIDILYNNAGAVRFAPMEDQAFEDWRFTLAAELDSVFLVTRAAWPHLKAARGCVINVGSTAGLTGSMTNQRAAHTAAKGGVIAMTRQLAAEGAPHGIRVNCVSPGMIATPGAGETLLADDHPMRAIAQAIPLGRLGAPHEIAAAAVFLASDEAGYVTGANLVVDGGWSAVLPG